MDMIDRVAKALFADYQKSALGPDLTQTWSTLPNHAKDHAYSQARAAIAAMREPTDEMNDAGADKCDGGCAEESCQCGFMGKIWTAMIDAALECSTKPDGQ
jgi:hypothetical protein